MARRRTPDWRKVDCIFNSTGNIVDVIVVREKKWAAKFRRTCLCPKRKLRAGIFPLIEQKLVGKVGRVIKIENGEVHVKFNKDDKCYAFHPATLRADKTSSLADDDTTLGSGKILREREY